MARLRIATRSSAQALAQSRAVADALAAAEGHDVELVHVETTGDRDRTSALHSIGGQGVFVKEVQRAVLDGRADLAVHSAKDLPSTTEPGLRIGAFCERRSPHDALVGRSLDALAPGAVVATGSVRRRAQLTRARPDLGFVELRGNIGTRLERIPDDGAIVMAVAALEILGLTDRIAERLDPGRFVPAVGQGCVAVEHRDDDGVAAEALASIDHAATRRSVTVERAYLAELGAGCSAPVGAHVRDGVLLGYLADGSASRHADVEVPLSGDLARDVELAREAAADARRRVSS